jgi:hypothetical protein
MAMPTTYHTIPPIPVKRPDPKKVLHHLQMSQRISSATETRLHGRSSSSSSSTPPPGQAALRANLGALRAKMQHLAINAQLDAKNGKTGEQYRIVITGLHNLAAYLKNLAQQQNSSSSGTGFWNGMDQRFKNWFNDDRFKTDEELDREARYSTHTTLPSEVDLSESGFSALNDQAGLIAALLDSQHLGVASAVVSVLHDPSFLNMDLTGLSITVPLVIPGTDVPIAAGFAAYSGSKFAGDTLTIVFTPDASQSDTINANGVTVQNPQTTFDSGNW